MGGKEKLIYSFVCMRLLHTLQNTGIISAQLNLRKIKESIATINALSDFINISFHWREFYIAAVYWLLFRKLFVDFLNTGALVNLFFCIVWGILGTYFFTISHEAFCLLHFYAHVKNGASDILVLWFGIILCSTFTVSLHPFNALECAVLMQVSLRYPNNLQACWASSMPNTLKYIPRATLVVATILFLTHCDGILHFLYFFTLQVASYIIVMTVFHTNSCMCTFLIKIID